jgi:CheY-like chemotaxis protein
VLAGWLAAAGSGEGAAAAYDLIITDWKMPVMDGHEVRHAVCVSAKP